ncbi:MAG: hypothetical protein HY553_10995 [Elusimicrobia bacterium]|nr:hypothetical protein [Elusimicrobiota bacterium]
MGLTRRLSATNALVGVLSIVFPPLGYLPGGALAGAGLTVGGVWLANRYWVGPSVLSTARQRRLADVELKDSRIDRMGRPANVAGSLTRPPKDWVDQALSGPAAWKEWGRRLSEVRIFEYRHRLSADETTRVLSFLEAHAGDHFARQAAFLVFRVGGAPKELYRWAERVHDDHEATYLFDALVTRELLADSKYPDQFFKRQPWATRIYRYLGGRVNADGDAAFGVFDDEHTYYVRASGDRSAESWEGCEAEGGADLDYSDGPPFGVVYFRSREKKSSWRDESLLRLRGERAGTGVALRCGSDRIPPSGGITLKPHPPVRPHAPREG